MYYVNIYSKKKCQALVKKKLEAEAKERLEKQYKPKEVK